VGKVDGVDLWAYSYASVQRPGVRVREHILGDDVGGQYWRFDDAYHMQSGNGRQGDLPGDFKFMYGAAVIRDAKLGQGVYAIYGSGWVMTLDDDPMGARVMPPFQGAAGGPNGGPLFTIHGREIDMFFLPLGIRPGAVLEAGESFRMAGPIMPTLPSHVEYTVTAPNGTQRIFQGRANNVGYFYQPEDDFVLDQVGLWTVELKVTHDGMTSAGPVERPYPTGGPMTIDGSTFGFVVTGPETRKLAIETSLSELSPAEWFSDVRAARFEAALPNGWSGDKARVIVTMSGIVLVDEEVPTNGPTVTWNLDAEKLNQLANNFDYEQGIADTIGVTFYAQGILNGAPAQAVGAIVTHGARVPTTPEFSITLSELPELSDFIANPTDQFVVDMVYVSGGTPFLGQRTKSPDNGAHVHFDNSGNQWPEGTAVTDFPAIYAVADGYVRKISPWDPVGGNNYKYDIWFVFAQKAGTAVRFLMSIEPMTNPGDNSFYEPFIVVKEGQSVRKGDVLAYMYLPPNEDTLGPHIHFSVAPVGEEQQAPAIFTDELVEAFHNNWGKLGFDRENNVAPSESDTKIPACMGYKLAANENPFAAIASECLK
ncbi:M23 family metallopeptidase, partial [Dehalococcoidia bacterium]|nr:M23 family metallopeptidase [Dehalococcoidia bacterium]MCL0101690.1 M23 family metallopeptidase [Dehalococcoidia bacterium]